MALTQGQWIQQIGGDSNLQIWKANVAFTTGENDAYTYPIPKAIDTTRQYSLVIQFAATPDGQALPVDLWLGYGDSFALSGDGANVVATNGFNYKEILNDAVLAVAVAYHITIDPDLPVADVVTVAAIGSGLKVRVPKGLRAAFNLDAGSTLNATNADFYVIQSRK